jgi:hypothetical protein
MVKRRIKPATKSIAGVHSTIPPHIVANQLKTLMPVGIAIIIVAAVKKALESISRPTVYM